MKKKNLKNILIFGAGSVGTHHANAARTLNCNVLICDINFSQFEYMKNNLYPKRYGGWDKKIKFISYRDVFESNNIYDLIIIGVPPKIHLTLLKQCFVYLNFKKILVEKPLCVFNQNFSFINQKKYKDKIYCGFNHSISKSFLFLINLILKKKIGKIKKIEINWKEDFKLILKAHPWIKNLKQSYLSNLRKGGGACHEYSHAVHLAVIFKKILFKNKIKIIKNIVYIKKNNSFYDSITQISFKDELRSIDLNIDAISNPCQKNIKIFGNNGTIIWERKIEKNYEKIEIRKGKNLNYKLFKLTRRDDFINQIKSLLFKKKKYNNSSNLKLESAVEVMNILKKFLNMFKKFKKNNKELQDYANKIIPGLSGLLGKRPEMYLPGGKWPTYYSKAKGLYIWDLQGKKYLDFTMVGVGSCVLGYSDNEIDKVAKKIISTGPLTTLNPPEEIELAEILLGIHNWAEQVKFARTGGEMMAVAVRLARAFTKKEKIMICGYHGWHDWYLAANISNQNNLNNHLLPGLNPRGVPKALKDTIIPFSFNNFENLRNIVKKRANECAAIIMEPARNSLANKSFLGEIRKIASKNNCVLIFDEITSAWRNDTSGIHKELGVNPDLATFGKTMANGIPIAALIGKKEIMELVKDTFISSTNWTERLGSACAVAFIKKHKRLNLGKILQFKGKKIRNIWTQSAKESNLKIKIDGILPLSSFKIETQNKNDWPIIITYFIQEMLKKKILASDRCYSNYCQSDRLLNIYKKACREIFKNISFYLSNGTLRKKLDGPIKQMGFKQLN